jgi:nucleotide-binding universal stress UspA family protein
MSTIICATDLSELARPAMAVAAALSRALHARLELLHVVHVPPGLPPEIRNDVAVARDLLDGASAVMEARAADLRKKGFDVGVCVRPSLVDDGIIDRAREIGAELIVVGTHAREGAARLFLGSVAERTVRGAPCPVVVVPPSARGRLVSGEPPAGVLRILAGIDASPASDAALSWLRGVGERASCDVRLVHLFWPVREHERLGLGRPDPFEADPEAIAVLTRELEPHVRSHLGREDVPLRVRPSWGGEENPLAWEAETDEADLLVVGTSQGPSSTAIATLRGAHLPVVCVPKRAFEATRHRLAPVRTVLVTTDFSPLGDAAVAEGYRLLLRGGGNVVLAHVAEPGFVGIDEDRREEIETCLLSLVPRGVDSHAIHTRTLVAADAQPADAILKIIRRIGPDVVVMASHGRSGINRALHGSVAEHVLRASPRPVLVVPAAAAEPANQGVRS